MLLPHVKKEELGFFSFLIDRETANANSIVLKPARLLRK
jgi:hypothetical protein